MLLDLTFVHDLIRSWHPLARGPGSFYWIAGEHNVFVLIFKFKIISRAERKKDQVCSAEEYQKVFARLQGLPQHVEHLVVLVGK